MYESWLSPVAHCPPMSVPIAVEPARTWAHCVLWGPPIWTWHQVAAALSAPTPTPAPARADSVLSNEG